MAVLAACDSGGGGGPCSVPGSNGSVGFTFQSQSFTASCFSARVDAGTLTFTSQAPAGQTAAVMQLTLKARDPFRTACPWHPGATAALASGCVDMIVNGLESGTVAWTAMAGTSAGSPAPTGSVTVNDWATGSGQLASVLFSSDAALTSTTPDGGTLVPISGSATTLTAGE